MQFLKEITIKIDQFVIIHKTETYLGKVGKIIKADRMFIKKRSYRYSNSSLKIQ